MGSGLPRLQAGLPAMKIGLMNEKDSRLKTSRQTRLKNLTAKKADRGELEPLEEKELERLRTLIASTESKETEF